MKKFLSVCSLLLCWGSVALAYFYFQLYVGLPPCPLCILDRIVLIMIGVCIAIMLVLPITARFFHSLGLLFLVMGFAVGIRHIWLERAPQGDSAACVQQAPIQNLLEFLTSAFIGTDNCAIVFWRLWGLSLADLTLILYVVLALLLWLVRPYKKSSPYQKS